jgi:SAM-dependent methyltransferase
MGVEHEIARGNPWYVADQAVSQLGTWGTRNAIENRWRLFRTAVELWLRRRPPRKGLVRVLDAGCGDGNNVAVLYRVISEAGLNASLVGSDYNPLRLIRARERTAILPLAADLLSLPFADGSFDLILCSHVIEHINADVNALRELKRVLAPNGMLLIGVPNEGCLLARLRNKVLQRSILRTTDHVQFYTSQSLVARCRMAGLVPFLPVMREGFFLPHLGLMLRLRETAVGSLLIDVMLRILPSQAAGLVAGFVRTD